MTDPSQICPSPILLELLELFQDVNCNNERLKGGTLKPLITELLLHGKPFFFFSGHPEKTVFPKILRWNMIFLALSGKMIFLFSENLILHVRRKIKDDLS